MTNLTQKAERWPRRSNGEIVFKTTHDALFYANLITKDKRRIDEIEIYFKAARRQIKVERDKIQPNLNRMMELAVKAQFFRECIEEVMRILVEE